MSSLTARIDALKPSLADLKLAVANRKLLLEKAQTIREYKIGAHANQLWVHRSKIQILMYKWVVKSMEKTGYKADEHTVRIWEQRVQDMLQYAKTAVEVVHEENGWEDYALDDERIFEGEGWEWETAAVKANAKKGAELEELVCPLEKSKPNSEDGVGKRCHGYAELSSGARTFDG